MKRILIALTLVLAGCTGDPGPVGLAGTDGIDGTDGQDAFLVVRTWERAALNSASITVNIPWNAGEDVIVLAEVLLFDSTGSTGWAPIATLWTPGDGSTWQTACLVDDGARRIWLLNAFGTYRVRLFVLN